MAGHDPTSGRANPAPQVVEVPADAEGRTPTLGHGYGLFEAAVAFTVTTSLVALVAESEGHFSAWASLTSGAIAVLILGLCGLSGRRRGGPASSPQRFPLLALLPLIALHLILRVPTYSDWEGGQDQGLYHAMAHLYATTGSRTVVDRLGRDELLADEVAVYARNGGFSMPSLVPTDEELARYRVEFYPLHPLWMAMAYQVLGPSLRGASTVAFSVLGLLAAWALALELSGGSRRAAALCAALIAVHPGLAFIVKFQVTETLAFALSCTSFYYLARAWRRRDHAPWLEVALAFGSFACFALSRPQSFAAAPVLLAMTLPAIVSSNSSKERRLIEGTLWAMALTSWLSALYFGFLLPEVHGDRIARTLRPAGLMAMAVGALGILGLGFLLQVTKDRAIGARVLVLARRWAPLLLLLACCVEGTRQLWNAELLARTGTAYAHGFYSLPPGLLTATRSLAGRLLVYWTPFGLLLLALGLVMSWRQLRGSTGWLALFLLFSLEFHRFAGASASSYSFYYDRTLFCDVVPYGLILVALFATSMSQRAQSPTYRRTVNGLVAATLGSFALGSAFQIGRSEEPGRELPAQLASTASAETLVFVDISNLYHSEALVAGVRLELGLEVFQLTSASELASPQLQGLLGRQPQALLLTGAPVDIGGASLITVVEHKRSFFHDGQPHMQWLLARSHPTVTRVDQTGLPPSLQLMFPPTSFSSLRFPVYFYQLQPPTGPPLQSSLFEAETMPSTNAQLAASPGVNDPLAHNGRARLVVPGDRSGPTALAAVYGPYLSLTAGCYEAGFRVSSDPSAGVLGNLDVASGLGQTILAQRILQGSDFTANGAYETIRFPFFVPSPLKAELRVWYLGGAPLKIDFVETRGPADKAVCAGLELP